MSDEERDSYRTSSHTCLFHRNVDGIRAYYVEPQGRSFDALARQTGKDEGRVMAFPRKNAPGRVPAGVRIANRELAVVFFRGSNPLATLEHGGAVHAVSQSESKTVGPLTTSSGRSLTYAADAPAETLYPAVAGLLAPYVEVAPGKAAGGVCRTIERA